MTDFTTKIMILIHFPPPLLEIKLHYKIIFSASLAPSVLLHQMRGVCFPLVTSISVRPFVDMWSSSGLEATASPGFTNSCRCVSLAVAAKIGLMTPRGRAASCWFWFFGAQCNSNWAVRENTSSVQFTFCAFAVLIRLCSSYIFQGERPRLRYLQRQRSEKAGAVVFFPFWDSFLCRGYEARSSYIHTVLVKAICFQRSPSLWKQP